jgi:hypothetical protein
MLANPAAWSADRPDALRRSDLVIPESTWAIADAEFALDGGPLGLDPTRLAAFGRDAHVLRPVLRQFRDLRETLRFSGRATDLLLENAAIEDELLRHAFAEFLDEWAGRRVRLGGIDESGISGELPGQFDSAREPGGWGVSWLERDGEDLAPDAAFAAAVARLGGDASSEHAAFRSLPLAAQRLSVRLLVGVIEAGPWVRNAFDRSRLEAARVAAVRQLGTPWLYAAAVAPWIWRESEPLDRAFFDLIGSTDLSQLAHGSVLLAKRVRLALEEFERDGGAAAIARSAEVDPRFATLRIEIPTPAGPIVIAGPGDHLHRNDHLLAPVLLLELGGDDRYEGAFATSDLSAGRPVSLLVDLGGNDTYTFDESLLPTWDAGGPPPGGPSPRRLPTLACGLFGLGMLWDLGGGDDQYRASESSLGCGWHGVGLLVDDGGDDRYELETRWGQGAASVGVGVLVDRGGNDAYTAGHLAQGLGMTRGAGILVEVAGDDRYEIRDDGAPSELYLGRTVAMGQGCGYGRRGDLFDGRSLAGGFGVLVDGAGDDHYHAMAWAQGCGYWWGVGILEDRGGDDTYRSGKYALGAAAHFAVGVFVDLDGDDRYNTSPERMTNAFDGSVQWVAENQFAGHARDGGVAIFVDGGGRDAHLLRANCGGSADLNSVALFWSRGGDDTYTALDLAEAPKNPLWERPPLGTVTHAEGPFRSFRDDLPSRALFIAGPGRNAYEGLGDRVGAGRIWRDLCASGSIGIGIDEGIDKGSDEGSTAAAATPAASTAATLAIAAAAIAAPQAPQAPGTAAGEDAPRGETAELEAPPTPPVPTALYLSWQRDPTTTMTIQWHETAPREGAAIEFGRADGALLQRVEAAVHPMVFRGTPIHTVELTSLDPDTLYRFQIVDAAGQNGEFRTFRTMPATLERPLRIAIGGDVLHRGEWMEQTSREALRFDPDFIVWGGDLAYADGREDRIGRWDTFFEVMNRTTTTADGRMIPVVMGIGNHEVQGGYYWAQERGRDAFRPTAAFRSGIAPFYYNLFAFPGDPGYGVLDFGDYLSLVLLDTDHTNPIEGAQTTWLAETLAARRRVPHLVPVYHVPGFPSVRRYGGSTSTRVRTHWSPLFEHHGIRFAFENHDHAYKRTPPIRGEAPDRDGVVYIGDGAWGVGVREVHDPATTWYLERAESRRHLLLLTITPEHADLKAWCGDGTLIDHASRPARRVPAAVR